MSDLDFSVRHPVWLRYYKRWVMGYDMYRGGIHVKLPSIGGTMGRERVRGSSSTDAADAGYEPPEPLKADAVMQWVDKLNNTYLFRHDRETTEEFRERRRRVYNWAIFQWAVNILTSGVLKVGANREGSQSDPWSYFLRDVDLNGTNMDHHVSHTLALALAFGRMHAIVDRPFFEDVAPNRKAQVDRGERAFARMVTPLDLVDWAIDENGQFSWVTIREDALDTRRPGDRLHKPRDQYRVWYPDHWVLYTVHGDPVPLEGGGIGVSNQPQDATRYEETRSGSHPAGRVPLATIYACRPFESKPSMACESPMADMLDLNRYVLNKLSEVDEIDRLQAFSLLTLQEEMGGGDGGDIEVGPQRSLPYPAGMDRPDYISPDGSMAQGIFDRLKGNVFMARQMTPIGRGNAEFSMEERSAEALTNEKEDRNNWLATLAAACAEFEEDETGLVMAYDGGSPLKIAYPRTYDVRGTMAQIQELGQLVQSSNVLSPLAEAALTKPIVSKKLKEHGKDEAEIAKVEKSIDEEAAKPPPPPPAPPPAGDPDPELGEKDPDVVDLKGAG